MRSDDEIALDVGKPIVAWIRNPVGIRGESFIMGDDNWPHGYRVFVERQPMHPYEMREDHD